MSEMIPGNLENQLADARKENAELRELLHWAICWAEAFDEEHPSDNSEVFRQRAKEIYKALKL